MLPMLKKLEDNKKRIAAEDAQFLEMQRLTLSDVDLKSYKLLRQQRLRWIYFIKMLKW
jgi:hypothetical protein